MYQSSLLMEIPVSNICPLLSDSCKNENERSPNVDIVDFINWELLPKKIYHYKIYIANIYIAYGSLIHEYTSVIGWGY